MASRCDTGWTPNTGFDSQKTECYGANRKAGSVEASNSEGFR